MSEKKEYHSDVSISNEIKKIYDKIISLCENIKSTSSTDEEIFNKNKNLYFSWLMLHEDVKSKLSTICTDAIKKK